MIHAIANSVTRKLMAVVLIVVFISLTVAGAALLLLDIRTYRNSWLQDLTTQADLVARISAPALAFNDPKLAREYLELLRSRPFILAAAIYEPGGRIFASYFSTEGQAPIPPADVRERHEIRGNQVEVFHRLEENGELLGMVYLRANFDFRSRLKSYAAILGVAMAISLMTAAVVSIWLQSAFTKPILAMARVAHGVMERRDFSLRVKKSTEDELGLLVDAFNAMLSEVGRRAGALEESNRLLENEMKERRSAEQALLHADRRKDEFLATLAHELRNPLAPLLNGLAILRQQPADSALGERAREIMERQLQQMVRLVDDLLDVSRITTGKLAVRKELVQLQPLLQSAIELNAVQLERRGQVLAVQMPGEPVWLDADPIRLSQVFSNLLNNASKYTGQDGRIVFSVRVEGLWVLITVQDNGIGIAPEMLGQIFEMFIQADYAIERAHAGLGVGLTLARRLVELHGGSIEAHSPGIGQGSSFVLRLPLAGAPAPEAPPEPGQTAGDRARLRILLTDDNVDFAATLATLLGSQGHTVQVTHSGAEALEAAPAFQPDFAFLDIGLPGMSGYELARRLRAMPATASCMLVAVTGWGQEKDRKMARQAGFDHHMVKPVNLEQVAAVLAREPRSAGRDGPGSPG